MRILAFDCSGQSCSAALCDSGRVLARRDAVMARGQAEVLIPMIEDVRKQAGLLWTDLDLLAVTVGPGTFTGLRIGLAAVRSLALASGLPVAGIATPDVMAAAVPESERQGRILLVAVDGKRSDVFVRAYGQDLLPLGETEALLPEQAEERFRGQAVLLAGDGVSLLQPVFPQAPVSSAPPCPDAALLAALAGQRWQAGTALPPQPLYLRPPDVTLAASLQERPPLCSL